ncbi:hypothetical protein M0R45_019955 [Rubus argutus]|uniref:Uncharacterized protein n=1 Tax=Rubus argutus TaxID=59490 RepID=A0AAW1X6X3_RUBAR
MSLSSLDLASTLVAVAYFLIQLQQPSYCRRFGRFTKSPIGGDSQTEKRNFEYYIELADCDPLCACFLRLQFHISISFLGMLISHKTVQLETPGMKFMVALDTAVTKFGCLVKEHGLIDQLTGESLGI